MEDIAIVILNWNGKHFLEKHIPSLIKFSESARIIVADNASTDDSISFLKTNFKEIEIIINETNGGFAKGYNDALKHVEAKYFLLINSDVEVTAGWLTPLYNAIQEKNIVSVQPKIKAFHSTQLFEHAGAAGGFIDKNGYPFCRGRIFQSVEEDLGQYDNETEVFWTSGACMLVKSSVFKELNGFDEDFFAHMEEIDLCWRMKHLGYALKVIPSSTVFHVGGGTLNYESPNKVYLNFRNNLYLILKNYQGNLFLKICYRMVLDGLAGIQFLTKGKVKHFFAILRAHFTFYGNIRKMYAKRKEIDFSKNRFNSKGYYSGSILWAFFFKRIKKFSDLNQRLFKETH